MASRLRLLGDRDVGRVEIAWHQALRAESRSPALDRKPGESRRIDIAAPRRDREIAVAEHRRESRRAVARQHQRTRWRRAAPMIRRDERALTKRAPCAIEGLEVELLP